MTEFLELVRRARAADLRVLMRDPAPDIPDVRALLGVPLEPLMESLYRITNGCMIGNLFVHGAIGVPGDIVNANSNIRRILDYIPFLHDVLVCAGASRSSHQLAAMPAHADERGYQPIVLLDANDVPYIMPLASTLNRALELVIMAEIGASRDEDWAEEGFPLSVAHFVANDVRLMELVRAGVFDDIGRGVDIDPEWHELLRELAPA